MIERGARLGPADALSPVAAGAPTWPVGPGGPARAADRQILLTAFHAPVVSVFGAASGGALREWPDFRQPGSDIVRSFKRSAWVLFGIGVCAGGASADVLYSNFGLHDAYDTTFGWTLSYGGPLGGDAYEDAVPFTVTGGNFALDSAEVAVNHFWGPDLVHFNLHADGGGVPGIVLDSASASGVVTPGTLAPPMLVNFGGDLILQEGQTYWLALRTDETDAHLSWAFNVVDDFGLRAWQVNNGPWNPAMGIPGTDSERGVFRINGTPVPAPASLGLLALAGLARRRRGRS